LLSAIASPVPALLKRAMIRADKMHFRLLFGSELTDLKLLAQHPILSLSEAGYLRQGDLKIASAVLSNACWHNVVSSVMATRYD